LIDDYYNYDVYPSASGGTVPWTRMISPVCSPPGMAPVYGTTWGYDRDRDRDRDSQCKRVNARESMQESVHGPKPL